MATKSKPQKSRLVRATKRPDPPLREALRQPPGGDMPTKALIARARKAWGIEQVITEADLVAVKPKTGGNIVHAKFTPQHTLCTIDMRTWANGYTRAPEDEPVNCLWCLCRVKGR